MNITVTLFHGGLGWAAGILAIAGAGTIFDSFLSWLTERYSFVFPFILARRWDRPGARVRLPDGRAGWVIEVHEGGDAGDMATVRTCDAGEREQSEWVPAHHLEPLAQPKPEEVAS